MTTPTRCHCNPNHDKFHLYLIQLVVIFLNVCLWWHSLRSNLGGIDPEKLYLATFICQYTLYCCIVWPSFLFVNDCFVNIWATCDNFLGKWLSAPSGKKLPVRLCPFLSQNLQNIVRTFPWTHKNAPSSHWLAWKSWVLNEGTRKRFWQSLSFSCDFFSRISRTFSWPMEPWRHCVFQNWHTTELFYARF